MILDLTLSSKNYQTLVNFFKVFNEFCQKNQTLNTSLISQKKKQQQIKTFSVLKSPHVNKKSKQKLKLIHYCINAKLRVFEKKKTLFILKLINLNMFPDLKIKIKTELKNKRLPKISKINPNLFKFQQSNNFNKCLKSFDNYGEELFLTKK